MVMTASAQATEAEMKKPPNGHKRPLPPIILPPVPCRKCGLDHPDRMMMNTQESAGYLRHTVSSLYSMKSKGALPPCIPGRQTPFWIPCELARYLFPRPVAILRDLLAARKVEFANAAGDEKARVEFEIKRIEFELRRSIKINKSK